MHAFDDRLLVFDTETTGTDVERDRVVELGACYFEKRAYVEHRRNLVDPGVPIPKEASEVHGITDARVAGKPRFEAIAARFVAHIDGSAKEGSPPLLSGYNALGFDVPLLNAELARAGLDARIDPGRVHDPMIFVRWHLRELRSRSLGAACERFGIKLDNAHTAAADARATGELLFRMIEEGIIPDEPPRALARQAELAVKLEEEWDAFGYWLYRDRDAGFLRIGAGKHCGAPLDDVDPGYLDFLVAKIDDLHPGAREVFMERVSPRG